LNIRLALVSPLTKVRHDQAPLEYPGGVPLSMLRGETLSLQAAYRLEAYDGDELPAVSVRVDCDLPVQARRVFGVPVRYPRALRGGTAETPCGVFPDLLRAFHPEMGLRLYPGRWEALWLDVEPEPDATPGLYSLSVRLLDKEENVLAQAETQIELLKAESPRQRLKASGRLNADCLASHYHVPVFSVEHNRILRNFVALSAKRGMNMMLTPIHTPPLDTAPGEERMTAQLAEVFVTPLGYTFRFGKLRDFIALCRHEGIRYFEMAPLAAAGCGRLSAPKIMGVKDGAYTQLFGWQTDAASPEYLDFLAAYLPALMRELSYLDVLGQCVFHVAELPLAAEREQYKALVKAVTPLLPGVRIADVLDGPEFLADEGGVIPIAPVSRPGAFSGYSAEERWVCHTRSAAGADSGDLIAMPACVSRMLGVKLYQIGADGFIVNGYNYYFSAGSRYLTDPYLNTDNDGLGPAGSAFLVYPAEGGQPEESLRLMLFQHAMQDLAALQKLESLEGRDAVFTLIGEGISTKPGESEETLNEVWLLDLRGRLNARIAQAEAEQQKKNA